MGKVIYTHLVSADGYIETDESYKGENWATSDEELSRHFLEIEATSEAHLYGRRVYQQVAAWWPVADQRSDIPPYMAEYAKIWREKPKYVFSTILSHAEWNATIISRNAVEAVKDLKTRSEKDLFLYGGVLASSLISSGVIDEFRLYVNPVFIGKGKPMLGRLDGLHRLKFLDTKVFACGVVLLHYGLRI